MRDDPEAVPGVPVGELPVAWTLLVLGCVAGALLAGEFNRLTLRIAAPFLLVGGLLALASVRAVGRGTALATRGPYRWLRHPYSLGVLLMIAGAIVAMRSLLALVLFIPTVRVTLVRAQPGGAQPRVALRRRIRDVPRPCAVHPPAAAAVEGRRRRGHRRPGVASTRGGAGARPAPGTAGRPRGVSRSGDPPP